MGNPYDFVVDGALMLCEGTKHATFICKDRGLLIGNKPVGLQSDCSVNNFSKQYFGICKMTGRQCVPNFIGEWINTVEEDKVVDGKKLNDSMNSLRDSCLKAMIALKKYVDICHADFEDKNNDGVIDNIIYWFAHGFKTEEDNWNEIQANDDLKKWVNELSKSELMMLPEKINSIWMEYSTREPTDAKSISQETKQAVESVNTQWKLNSLTNNKKNVDTKKLEEAYKAAAEKTKISVADLKKNLNGEPVLMGQSVLICNNLGIVHFWTTGQESIQDSSTETKDNALEEMKKRYETVGGYTQKERLKLLQLLEDAHKLKDEDEIPDEYYQYGDWWIFKQNFNFPELHMRKNNGVYAMHYLDTATINETIQRNIGKLSKHLKVDYFLCLAIMSHETSCTIIPDDPNSGQLEYVTKSYDKARGIMQITKQSWDHVVIQNSERYKEYFALGKDLGASHIEPMNADLKKDDYRYDLMTSITVGIAILAEWRYHMGKDSWRSAIGGYGEGYTGGSTFEILYYRDVLAIEAGFPPSYENGDQYMGEMYDENGKRLQW